MNDSIIAVIMIAAIGSTIVYKLFFSKEAIIKRKLRETTSKQLTNFKDGEIAKVTGRIELIDEPLIAPLSKRKCAYYHVIVSEEVSSGKNSRWETIIDEEKKCRYLIKNDIYYALVDNQKINQFVVKDREYASGFLNDASDYLEKYLNSKGIQSEGLFNFNKTLEYKEGILEKGEKIAVLGRGIWKNATELDLPEKYGKVLLILPSDEDGIYLSDHPSTVV